MTSKKNTIGEQSLELHRTLRGKIEIGCKVAVKSKLDLSLVYTPGVGAVSTHLAKNPGDAALYTMKGNTVAVVSDGSAVLGLGNIGPLGALPVMEGKSLLFKTLANIDAIPLVLDTQDTDEIIRIVRAIAPGFGGINLEDIAAPRCFEIEAKLKKYLNIPVMHDDQHGTAMVVLAALINALKVVKKKMEDVTIVINGAGAAGQAIAELLLLAKPYDIIVIDSTGAIYQSRPGLDEYKTELSKRTNRLGMRGTLGEVIAGADVFVGVSKAGLLTSKMVESMGAKSIVFALANPVPEIMPEDALRAGAAVVGTGRSDYPNQINNSLGFPGIFRGALDHGVRRITNEHLYQAAVNLAKVVKKPTAEMIIPSTFDPAVVPAVSRAIK
jgi:malate dehydrogenase (oxaloacetate-decarboxylating)